MLTPGEEESPYRAVFDAARDAMVVYTLDGMIVEVNAATCRTYGYSREQLIGADVYQVAHPDARALFAEFAKTAVNGNAFHCETIDRRADGSTFPIEVTGTQFTYAGRPHLLSVIRDVTDRKRIEERLRTSEERLALSINASRLGTFYCPMPLGRIEWNDICKAHFWLPPEAEIDFDVFYDRLHPDDRERTREAVTRAITTGEPYDIEYRTVAPDGRERWIRAKGQAYHDAAGNPLRFDGVTLDVTDRRHAVDALRESEHRFREMADTAPAMLWVTEPDGSCSFLSRGWYEFTGQTREEGLGFGWVNAAHPDDREYARQTFIDASLRRAHCEIDFRLRRADGEYRWVIDAGRPRFGPNGEFLGYIGSVIDITDRKRAEEERNSLLDGERAARADAERASRMKDEFLATLSHELRTPLNAILGWSQLLTRGTVDAQHVIEGLQVIERNARAQTQIIEDLLDMSRIISGKVRLELSQVDLAVALREAVDTVKPSADAKGVVLASRVDADDAQVLADPSRVQQVLWNLLSNAVKFTPRGGRVEVSLRRAGTTIDLRVSDNGEGISAEFLPHVFDRFRQADASITRRHGGLGLGLSIVKQLVDLHGGTIRADSAGQGRGAAFVVTLPQASAEASPGTNPAPNPRQDPSARHPALASCSDLQGIRVLVVDDEPDARELVKRLLEDCDATVHTAASAAEGLRTLQSVRPDVLVSDIGMPGEDGYSFIGKVRGLDDATVSRVPALALTAYARREDRARAIRAGFHAHLSKPLEPAELISTVAALAAGRSPSEE